MQHKVILALDFDSLDEVKKIVETLSPNLAWVKVGMQLFYKEDRKVLDYLKSKGLKIFLDLKLMDIPNTVTKAIKNLNNLPVDLLSIHLSGGFEMLKSAKEVSKIPLVGITVLTSLNDLTLNELGINHNVTEQVLKLAKLAKLANIDHLVSSPFEIELLTKNFNDYFTIITPGIRQKVDLKDQKRVMTAKEALTLGTNFIVVGREVTESNDMLNTFLNLGS